MAHFYCISKDYTCKGDATQAAKGLIKYLFESTNCEVLNATALTYNTPSNKVIEKCGFRVMGTIEIDGESYYYYKLKRSEWKIRINYRWHCSPIMLNNIKLCIILFHRSNIISNFYYLIVDIPEFNCYFSFMVYISNYW